METDTVEMLIELKTAFNSSYTRTHYEDKAWDIYVKSNVSYATFVRLKNLIYNELS